MAFSFFSKKQKQHEQQLYLSLDIGTEFIKAVVFSTENDTIAVHGVGKVRQLVSNPKNGQIANIKSLVETTKSAIEKAMDGIDSFQPTEVIMGIAGELVKGISVIANYNREQPESKITMDEVMKIFDKIKNPSMEEAKNIFIEYSGNTKPQIRSINASIIEAFIDGVRVENVLDATGKNIKLTIYSTYAAISHVGSLDQLAKQLKLKPLLIAAEPFAVARSIVGARDEGFDAIVIDIGGGTSDITIIKKGVVVDTHMIAFGARVFTKRIAQEMHVDFEKAEKLKQEYVAGALDEITKKTVQAAIEKDKTSWLEGIVLTLKEFETVKVFPSSILLCGGGALLPETKISIINYDWTHVLPFNRVPKVTFILPQNIDKLEDPKKLADSIDMVTSLALARLTLDVKHNLELVKGG